MNVYLTQEINSCRLRNYFLSIHMTPSTYNKEGISIASAVKANVRAIGKRGREVQLPRSESPKRQHNEYTEKRRIKEVGRVKWRRVGEKNED